MRSKVTKFLALTLLIAACAEEPAGRSSGRGNDGDPVAGTEGGPCYPNATCNEGLVCMADRCETNGATGSDTGTVDTDNPGGDAGTVDAADGDSDTGTVDTSTPPVEETVGPEGGVIEFGEIRLTIPAGALAAATPIAISYAEQQAVAGYSPYTALYRFEPAGTRFQVPATVSARFTGDSGRATLFWTPDGGTGFERRGGRVGVDGRLEDQILHFSEGFVGDGVTYTDLSDRSCVVTRLVEGRNATPAGINGGLALFFTVDDCQGRPVTGLNAADFSLLEDGRPLSSEAQATILPADGRGIFVSLVLDFSASTEPVLPELLDGAAAFLDALEAARLPAQVQLMAFGGEATAYVAQAYTLDLAAARTALSELAAWRPSDIGATNLHGAVVQALGESEAAQAAFRARNLGGAFSTGYVVVFTDGGDTAERVNRAQVQSAVSASADEVFMVGLRGADYDAAALTAITSPQNVLAAPSAAEIEREFAALANRLAGQALSTYLLGYCSPKRAGSHTVSVQVTGAENRSTASFSFGADGFDGSCRASAFETICDGNDCGGLGCGACDDRMSVCIDGGGGFVCEDTTPPEPFSGDPLSYVWRIQLPQMGTDAECCFDLTGDGVVDNGFSTFVGAIGAVSPDTDIQAALDSAVADGKIGLVVEYAGLSETTRSGPTELWFYRATNDLDGDGTPDQGWNTARQRGEGIFQVMPSSLAPDGSALFKFEAASIDGAFLDGGVGAFPFSFPGPGGILDVPMQFASFEADVRTGPAGFFTTDANIDSDGDGISEIWGGGKLGGLVSADQVVNILNDLANDCACAGIGPRAQLILAGEGTDQYDISCNVSVPFDDAACTIESFCGNLSTICGFLPALPTLGLIDVDTNGNTIADAMSVGLRLSMSGAALANPPVAP